MSRYRITMNNGRYRVEEFRRCGFLWLKRDWKPIRWGHWCEEYWIEESPVFASLEDAKRFLEPLRAAERIDRCPWTPVETDG